MTKEKKQSLQIALLCIVILLFCFSTYKATEEIKALKDKLVIVETNRDQEVAGAVDDCKRIIDIQSMMAEILGCLRAVNFMCDGNEKCNQYYSARCQSNDY